METESFSLHHIEYQTNGEKNIEALMERIYESKRPIDRQCNKTHKNYFDGGSEGVVDSVDFLFLCNQFGAKAVMLSNENRICFSEWKPWNDDATMTTEVENYIFFFSISPGVLRILVHTLLNS